MNKQINGEKRKSFPYNRMTTNTVRKCDTIGKSPFGNYHGKKSFSPKNSKINE